MAVTSKLPKPPVNEPALVPVGEHAGAPILLLDRVAVVVGADASCRLHLTSTQISRHHTLIVTTPDEIYVRDLCSRTQTFVNEEAVREAVLNHGDYLRVGRFRFKLSDPRSKAAKPAHPDPIELRVNGQIVAVAPESRTIVIGRRDECDVKLDDEAISTIHAVIFAVGKKRLVRDMHSRSGTRLNDEKIHQDELPDSAVLTIGASTMEILPVAVTEQSPAAADDALPPLPLETTDKEVPAAAPPAAPAVPLAIPVQPVAAPALEVVALSGDEENAAVVLAQPSGELNPDVIAPPVPSVEEPIVASVSAHSPLEPAALAPPVVEPSPIPLAAKAPDLDSLAESLEAVAPPAAAEAESPVPVQPTQTAEVMAVELPGISAVEEAGVVQVSAHSPMAPVAPSPLDSAWLPVSLAVTPPELDGLDESLEAVEPPAAAELESPAPVAPARVEEQIAAGAQVAPEIAAELPAASIVEESIAPLVEPEVTLAAAQAPAVPSVEPIVESSAATVHAAAVQPPLVEITMLPVAKAEPAAHVAQVPLVTDVVVEPSLILPAVIADQVAVAAGEVVSLPPVPPIPVVEPEPPVVAAETATPTEPAMAEQATESLIPLPPVPPVTVEDSEPPTVVVEATTSAESVMLEPATESLISLPPDIPQEISLTPPTMVVPPAFTLDEVSSIPDDQPLESLSPVAPAAEEPSGQDDAVVTVTGMDLGLSGEETLLVAVDPLAAPPEPTLPPGEISESAPPEPPSPPPAAPVVSAPPPLPVIGRPAQWSDSFSLDDGFFGADLDVAGVIVRAHGQALPESTPISHITTAPGEASGEQAAEEPANLSPPPAIPASLPLGMNMDFGIGGLGLTLPDLVPPPEDFGKVSVSFGDKGLPPRPGAPAIRPAEAPADELPLLDLPPEKLRAGAAAKFAAVPKSISTRAGSGAFSEDEASGQNAVVIPPSASDGTRADRAGLPTSIIGGIAGAAALQVRQKDAFSDVEPTALNDAAFGGQRLSKSDDYVIPETAAGKAAVTGEEIKDFSEDPFWDARDEDGSAPPPRISLPQAQPEPIKDVAHLDNPLAGEAGLVGQAAAVDEPVLPEIPETPEKTKEARPQRAHVPLRLDLSPLRRPPPVEAFQPRGPHGEPIVLRQRHKKLGIPLLLLLMLVAVAMALLTIYYTIGVKSKVTGNLRFNHVDLAPGSSQWEKWQADERALLEQPATLDIAQKTFKDLSTGANPGFLADYRVTNLARGGQFLPASGPDKPTVLRLVYDSSDLTQDGTRMMALLRAIAEANAPLTYAAHHRVTELKATDAEINVYHKQQNDLKDAQTSQVAIVAGNPTPERLASLEQAMATQLAAETAADEAVARDNEHLNRLLTTVPGEIPTTAPGGDVAAADPQLAQWLGQMKEWQEALAAAQAAGAQKDSDARQRVKDALERLDHDLLAAGAAMADHAELARSVASTRQLLILVKDLTAALMADNDHLAKDAQDFKRLLGLAPNDPQLVTGARELIGNEHKRIDIQKKGIDDAVGPLQNQINQLIVAAQALPAPQQDLIGKLKDRLEAFRQARRQLDAMTNSDGEGSEKVKALRQQVEALTGQIDQRQREVVAATQKRLSDQQHAALANQLNAARATLSSDQSDAAAAKAAYQTALTAYFHARINQENVQQATARLTELKLQGDLIQQKLDALQTKRLQITTAAGPIYDVKPVEDNDVEVVSVDNRQAYSLLATIGIAMVFSLILAVVSRRNRRDAQLTLTPPQGVASPVNAGK